VSTEGRAKIDWHAAFAFFASLRPPARTFVAVAEKFSVSDTAVRKHARRHDWETRVETLDRQAARQVERRVVRERAARIADTIELVDLARQELLVLLRDGKAEVRLADLPNLIRLEALLEGEATERLETREVREVLVAIFAEQDAALGAILDGEALEPPRRQAIVSAFRARTREAFAKAALLAAGGDDEQPEEPAA
jgi:hypothetical protein